MHAYIYVLINLNYIVDVGSGDGKYFGLNPQVQIIGCDRSLKLLEVSKQPGFDTFCCDAVAVPFRRSVTRSLYLSNELYFNCVLLSYQVK